MRVLGIIPARGGSKGVPGKNIYPIHGKPLINYTIESALDSKLLTKIIISTDSQEILDLTSDYNIDFHKRDHEHATDNSPIMDTVFEVLRRYKKEQIYFDAIALLQPTSPIKTGNDIDSAIELLENNPTANSVISVVEMDDVHPARMYWKNKLNTLDPILPKFEKTRRQDIPKALYRNGVLYLTRIDVLEIEKELMVRPTMPYIMDAKYLVNVDEPRDLLIAEVLIKAWKENKL